MSGLGFSVEACAECECEASSYHYPGCSGAPYVCPGCFAVAEPCAPGCIDAEIEREHQEALERADYGDPWEEHADWEYAP